MSVAGTLCIALGAFFVGVAALGVLRMPDLFTRMHAATKAGTLGAGLLLIGAALVLRDPWVAVRAVLTVAFLALTIPVASHLVARAAYRTGSAPLWSATIFDEWNATRNRDGDDLTRDEA
jgi:multicomponent Na+:H+ antiporter subunit G